MRFVMAVVSAGLAIGCTQEGAVGEDPSLYLTGTEEQALRRDDGTWECESPKKVLICHIPPGNPDNAHTICVGAPAVRAHEERHGDPVGACDADEEPDAGAPVDPDAAPPPPEPDAAPEPGPDGGGVD